MIDRRKFLQVTGGVALISSVDKALAKTRLPYENALAPYHKENLPYKEANAPYQPNAPRRTVVFLTENGTEWIYPKPGIIVGTDAGVLYYVINQAAFATAPNFVNYSADRVPKLMTFGLPVPGYTPCQGVFCIVGSVTTYTWNEPVGGITKIYTPNTGFLAVQSVRM